MLDDTPVVPGTAPAAFDKNDAARQVLDDAEDELRAWRSSMEPITSSSANLGTGAMPAAQSEPTQAPVRQEVPTRQDDIKPAAEAITVGGNYEKSRYEDTAGVSGATGTTDKSGAY